MLKTALKYLQAQTLYWAIPLALMAADDAAMLAMMFC
jgi:hypothetical protein